MLQPQVQPTLSKKIPGRFGSIRGVRDLWGADTCCAAWTLRAQTSLALLLLQAQLLHDSLSETKQNAPSAKAQRVSLLAL